MVVTLGVTTFPGNTIVEAQGTTTVRTPAIGAGLFDIAGRVFADGSCWGSGQRSTTLTVVQSLRYLTEESIKLLTDALEAERHYEPTLASR